MKWTDATCWMILALFAVILAAMNGCEGTQYTNADGQQQVEREVDWQEAKLALADARFAAEAFRPTVEERGRRESLDRVLALLDAADTAVDRRIKGEASDDAAVRAIRALLDVSGAIIAEWPNPQERAIASAAHVGLRMTLRTIHRRIEHRRIDNRPRDDPVDIEPRADG